MNCKKFLICVAIMIFVILLSSCVPKERQEGDWVYTIESEEVCITHYLNKMEHVKIPDEIDGFSVTRIEGNIFDSMAGFVESVVLPKNLKVIGKNAFRNCGMLKEIVIPPSVKTIEDGAFKGCKALENVIFEGRIYDVGRYALDETLWYENQPDGIIYIGKYAYACKGSYEKCCIKDGTTHVQVWGIDSDVVYIPESVVEIMPYAFAQSDIREIYFEDGTESLELGDYAFSWCDQLYSINFPQRLNKIGKYAFEFCTFSSVRVPGHITEIGEGAFSNCKNVKSVYVEGGLKVVSEKLFYGCSTLETIEMAEGVERVKSRAFSACPNVVNVTVPNSMKRMSSNAFWGQKRWNEPKYLHIIAEKGTYGEVFAHNHKFIFTEKGVTDNDINS